MNKSQDFQEQFGHMPDAQSYEDCKKRQSQLLIDTPDSRRLAIQEETNREPLVLGEAVEQTAGQNVRGRWYASVMRQRRQHEQIAAQNTCNK